MTQKYKLAPIEPTEEMVDYVCNFPRYPDGTFPEDFVDLMISVGEHYKTMNELCETVKVVDHRRLRKHVTGNEMEMGLDTDFHRGVVSGFNNCLDFLTQNGYKIVKVCNE